MSLSKIEKSNFKTEIINFSSGEEIFLQGEKTTSFYVILSGKVSLLSAGQKKVTLGPKNILGLEGLFTADNIYIYTARCESSSRLVKYPQIKLFETFLDNPAYTQAIISSLSTQLIQLWSHIDQNLNENFFTGEIKSYNPGELVIREGDDTRDIYRIISTDKGLEVSRENQVLAVLKEAGEFFGEMASILNESRTATVRSIGYSILEIYPPDQWENITSDYPEISLRVIKSLAQRLAHTSKSLARVTRGLPV